MNNLKSWVKAKSKFKLIAVIFFVFILSLNLFSIYIAYKLINPEREKIEKKPQNISFEEVSFSPVDEDLELKGWFLPAKKDSKNTIIMAHGYGGNRNDKIEVAEVLVNNNFNVFIFDFRNHGESAKDKTTIGYLEKKDLLGAVNYLIREKNYQHNIGLIGFSMGAATAALAGAETSEIKAIVMDSSFSDLIPYLEENLPIWSGVPAFPFNWLILNIGTKVFNLELDKVRPIEAVKNIEQPIFFIHGDEDKDIPFNNSLNLYENSSNVNDRLWRVPQAGHTEASEVAFIEYSNKIIDFFENEL